MILVLCPSRGRPGAAKEVALSFAATRALPETKLVFVLDEDDPSDYRDVDFLRIDNTAHTMVHALNMAASMALHTGAEATVLGFIGDDHRFRTPGWDATLDAHLAENPGFAYGADLFWHGGEIPTQVFVSADIIRALGWFGLPECRHLYIDNAWSALGEATNSLYWFPDVIIEHLHPAIGKAEWDEGHKRVNSQEMYEHDRVAFERWRSSETYEKDVGKVKAALQLHAGVFA